MDDRKYILRAVEPEDAELIFSVENDTEVWEYSDNVAHFSLNLLKRYAESYNADPWSQGMLRLIVCERRENMPAYDSEPLGIVDLYDISLLHRTAKVGIYVRKDFRKEGVAKQSLLILKDYVRSRLGLKSLLALVAVNNGAGHRLFASVGFSEVGMIPQWIKGSGEKNEDVMLYYLDCQD